MCKYLQNYYKWENFSVKNFIIKAWKVIKINKKKDIFEQIFENHFYCFSLRRLQLIFLYRHSSFAKLRAFQGSLMNIQNMRRDKISSLKFPRIILMEISFDVHKAISYFMTFMFLINASHSALQKMKFSYRA